MISLRKYPGNKVSVGHLIRMPVESYFDLHFFSTYQRIVTYPWILIANRHRRTMWRSIIIKVLMKFVNKD